MGLKIALFSFFVFQILNFSYGQQMPRIAQYMYNRQVYNPAATGTGEASVNAGLLYRLQWMGVGAPRFLSAWGDYRFTERRMAGGVNINLNKYGITAEKQFLLNYSYLLPVTKKLKLSMGLRAGVGSSSINPDELQRIWDSQDSYIDALSYSATYPIVGAGAQLYSSNFYLGFSSPLLFSGYKGYVWDDSKSRLATNIYTSYVGGIIMLNDSYRLLPSAMVYIGPAKGSRIDMTLLFEVNEYFYAGGTVTSKSQIVFSAGAYLSSRLRFGYAYEFQKAGEIANLNTHEINLRFSIDNLFNK